MRSLVRPRQRNLWSSTGVKEAIQRKPSRNMHRAHFESKYQSLHDSVKSHKTGKNLPRNRKLSNCQILHRARRWQGVVQSHQTHRKHIKKCNKIYYVNSSHKIIGVKLHHWKPDKCAQRTNVLPGNIA